MFELLIKLKTINEVYDFAMAIQEIPCDIDLMPQNRRYIVNAKSVMGVFSLDLSQPVILKAYSDDPEIKTKTLKMIEEICGSEP